jgi:hypothetical protein
LTSVETLLIGANYELTSTCEDINDLDYVEMIIDPTIMLVQRHTRSRILNAHVTIGFCRF